MTKQHHTRNNHVVREGDEHHNHAGHLEHGGHAGHGKHAGHSPEIFKRRFFICLVLTLPILYFSTQLQDWLNYEAIAFPRSEWINPVLAIIIYFYGGWVFLKGAWNELHSKIGMMTLIALAITVAFVYSLAVSLGLQGMPFYWELATLVDIMLLGHWIEMASVQGASRALENLAELVPSQAHRFTNGKVEDVAVSDIQAEDIILIRPGEQVPNDGIVIEGDTNINESFLTGESRPVSKHEGDEVVAGSVNGEGSVKVKVTRIGGDTTINQIMRLVEEAQGSRSRYQVLADRTAYWLTIIAIAAGSLTFFTWLFFSDLIFAVNRSVTVLVITCPHALGLAIPLVIANSTGLAAKNGILVRNRDALERAKDIKNMAFDKTGTLTEGRFAVQRVVSDSLTEEQALAIAAALETSSEHPLAKAVVEAAERRQLHLPQMTDFKTVTGRGVEGKVNGQTYRIGRPEWVEEQNLTLPSSLRQGLNKADERGESAVVLMTNKSAVAVISMADQVRERAREAVNKLKAKNIQVVMITGDAEAVARAVAEDLGIDRYYGRVLPEDKVSIIKQLKQEGATAFVGDGINDAAALLEANIGIAIGAGTNVAIESADLVLIEDDPLDAVKALNLAQKTYSKMIQNLVWATGYNVISIPLAAGVLYTWGILLSPAVGALLMSLSTVIVAINAVMLRRAKLA
ncbi:MAG: heavy metal translocating P-type ATPase [Pelatocladus maniniholoensis HA4357-MV3]|jgi:Cu2+-exporting ATPase|uniref:Heavy metal translocating P-type ATPase n=1 Tax=Pelatocladus maniniholoensis HA4357-MV3 TaxID=1117104 RepID=A0A9E3HBU4_9NOST|nr:heavy metal translocating P-type ATPase [Pelatocladus maniniholoensis HA4357-MV3]BAZ67463.1 heavy metal translocating P-type ATPase [Fischerella sp. NIES-4106]